MRKILTLLAVVAFVSSLTAQSKYAPGPNDKALLWQIVSADKADTSYLYGTIHMIASDDYFLTDNTKKAFGESQKVVMEVNMDEMNDPSLMFKMMFAAMMGGGKTLKDFYDTDEYARVKKAFEKRGVPMMMIDRMKPMFSSMMLTEVGGDGGGQIGSDPSSMLGMGGDIKSYEMEFMKMAKGAKKEIGGLETIDYQISLFDSISYEEQADLLLQAVDAQSAPKEAETEAETETEDQGSLEFLTKLYKEQDIYQMQSVSTQEESGDFNDRFLNDRNKNWIPIMSKMMKVEKTFFAVGAAHLGGEEGVIALLRQKGYQVSPMK